MKTPVQAVLFDLDGTLLDTAADISTALNRILLARGLTPLTLRQIRPIVGTGYQGLLKIGLNVEAHHAEYAALCQEFLEYYHEHVCDTTQFFAGMEAVLAHLEQQQIPWGVVTNKPGCFTDRIVARLDLLKKAGCVISGDTLSRAKPHPDPILHACKLLGQDPKACLYIGDAEIDMIAGKAAGMPVLAALYGYIPPTQDPRLWNADGYIQHPAEILDWLE
jgi:2-phosphoglycolate phosphatase